MSCGFPEVYQHHYDRVRQREGADQHEVQGDETLERHHPRRAEEIKPAERDERNRCEGQRVERQAAQGAAPVSLRYAAGVFGVEDEEAGEVP